MLTKVIQVNNNEGLHARPASQLARKAAQYKSDISMECAGKKANIKSVIGVLSLGVNKGASVKLIVSGPDEAQALDEISKFIETI